MKVYVFTAKDRNGVTSVIAVTRTKPTEEQQWELLEALARECGFGLGNYSASEFYVDEQEVLSLS